jgi:hypothetical protein
MNQSKLSACVDSNNLLFTNSTDTIGIGSIDRELRLSGRLQLSCPD